MKQKHIYLLIGPKGSGKSFTCTLFQEKFHIHFVRVEPSVLKIRKNRDLGDPEYLKDAFRTIEKEVRNALKHLDTIVFESTGITDYFDRMLVSLRKDFRVTTIRLLADQETCRRRIRNRDASIHIPVSDNKVEEINAAVLARNLVTDYTIDNTGEGTGMLMEEIRAILDSTSGTNPQETPAS